MQETQPMLAILFSHGVADLSAAMDRRATLAMTYLASRISPYDLGNVPIFLQIMPSITSSAPPPMEHSR